MIRKIITDIEQLAVPCEATMIFDHIVQDLLDTAESVRFMCAGLAANQIGYSARVIVVKIRNQFLPMVNPELLRSYGKLITMEESCLSFPGKTTKKTRRNKIIVRFWDPVASTQVVKAAFKGFEARTIQHEIDHLNGVLL